MMTEADDDMFAGMISAAMGQNKPYAREVTPKRSNQCPCGSGHIGYNLFDHTGRLLMYCCHSCEKSRRAKLNNDGETLTASG